MLIMTKVNVAVKVEPAMKAKLSRIARMHSVTLPDVLKAAFLAYIKDFEKVYGPNYDDEEGEW